MSRTIVILQSNYIPWKGYFDLMNSADVFVIYDEVQFTRRDWRNRNKIILNGKPHWLTIPVDTKGEYESPIKEVKVSDPRWAEKHWSSMRHAYVKAKYFDMYEEQVAKAYERAGKYRFLTEINELFLNVLSDFLSIDTLLEHSNKIPANNTDPTQRLLEICKGFNGKRYISGPSAKNYIDQKQFEEAAVKLHYANYTGYTDYKQNSETLEHGVSVIDLLMHEGQNARKHLKSVSELDGLIK